MSDLKVGLQIKINCQIGYHYAKNEEGEGIEIHTFLIKNNASQ